MINYVLCGADCLPVRQCWLAGRQQSLEASAQHSPPIWNCLLYYISGSEQLFHRADAVAKGRVSLSFLKHWAGCLTSRRRYLCILSHALLLWVTFNLLVSRLFSLCFTTNALVGHHARILSLHQPQHSLLFWLFRLFSLRQASGNLDFINFCTTVDYLSKSAISSRIHIVAMLQCIFWQINKVLAYFVKLLALEHIIFFSQNKIMD